MSVKYKKLPGHVLVEDFLVPYYPAELSDLAKRAKIPYYRLSGIIRGQDKIDNFIADRLAKFYGNPIEFWLDLQARYDRGEAL